MDDVIIARRDIEWAGPSVAVQGCESLKQADVLRALRLAEEACDGHVADEFLVSPAVMRVLHEAGELREPDGWMSGRTASGTPVRVLGLWSIRGLGWGGVRECRHPHA